MTSRWQSLAEFMERPAGEVFISFALVAVGVGLYKLGVPHAEEAIGGGITLVSRALVGQALRSVKSDNAPAGKP